MMGKPGGSDVGSRRNAVTLVHGLGAPQRFSIIAGVLVLTYLLGMADRKSVV